MQSRVRRVATEPDRFVEMHLGIDLRCWEHTGLCEAIGFVVADMQIAIVLNLIEFLVG